MKNRPVGFKEMLELFDKTPTSSEKNNAICDAIDDEIKFKITPIRK